MVNEYWILSCDFVYGTVYIIYIVNNDKNVLSL